MKTIDIIGVFVAFFTILSILGGLQYFIVRMAISNAIKDMRLDLITDFVKKSDCEEHRKNCLHCNKGE